MKVCVFLFLAAASILYRFQWGLVLDLLIAVSRKLICRCYKYARFIYFICFFLPRSLFSLLGTFHLPVWCLLFFFFFFLCHYFDSNNTGKATQLCRTFSVLWAGATVQPRGKSRYQGFVSVVTDRKARRVQETAPFCRY